VGPKKKFPVRLIRERVVLPLTVREKRKKLGRVRGVRKTGRTNSLSSLCP